MDEYKKIYNIIGTKKDKKVYIDLDALNLILELENFKRKPTQEEISKEKARAFRKDFQVLFRDCLAKGPRAWKNKENIIGETLGNDITYDPTMLELHYEKIKNLLERLGNLERYEDLMFLETGEQWTKLRQQIGLLMTLANAAGLLSFEESNLELFKKQENNPRLTRTKETR